MVGYVGLDVSKEETAFCVKDETAAILARGKVPTDPRTIFEALREHCLCPERILLKARCHLARQRRDTENTIRGLLGSLGIRFPKGSGKLAVVLHRMLISGEAFRWPAGEEAATA